MKLSANLPDSDVEYLDRYVLDQQLDSVPSSAETVEIATWMSVQQFLHRPERHATPRDLRSLQAGTA